MFYTRQGNAIGQRSNNPVEIHLSGVIALRSLLITISLVPVFICLECHLDK